MHSLNHKTNQLKFSKKFNLLHKPMLCRIQKYVWRWNHFWKYFCFSPHLILGAWLMFLFYAYSEFSVIYFFFFFFLITNYPIKKCVCFIKVVTNKKWFAIWNNFILLKGNIFNLDTELFLFLCKKHWLYTPYIIILQLSLHIDNWITRSYYYCSINNSTENNTRQFLDGEY